MIDANAIERMPVASYELMRRAAGFVFDTLLNRYPRAQRISVWCGKGNNAGDGYLVAALAARMGLNVTLVSVVPTTTLQDDAARAYLEASAAGVEPIVMTDAAAIAACEIEADVIVDALLGTGCHGAPRSPYQYAIAQINQCATPVVAVDLPSGVSTDTGAVTGDAVKAAVSVSFITRKIGLYTGAGTEFCGEREFSQLGVDDAMYDQPGLPVLRFSADRLPVLSRNTHKHRQGHVMVVGGDSGMPGAVAMAAHSALRAGAGMVTVVTRAEHFAPIVARTPEVMVVDPTRMEAVIERADLVVLGPGLGRESWGKDLFNRVERGDRPTVIDADGLYWLAQHGVWQGGDLYLTPHTGEAARLLNVTSEEVQSDRLSACVRLRDQWQATGVLKGAGSIVFDRAAMQICTHGNPGMATAGMGDVLSGVVGAMLVAAYVTDSPAADDLARLFATGVALHSAAADHAVDVFGMRSLLASDVIDSLATVLNKIAIGSND